MICPVTMMNNRQRAGISFFESLLEKYKKPDVSVYLMEQTTPIYNWYVSKYPGLTVTGSEYLGPDVKSGTNVNGINHEDVENLSFDNESFDFIISNDVLEHVNDPARAMQEAARVLVKGGVLLLTIPFYKDRQKNQKRAEIVNGKVKNYLPAEYHGNPMSDEGSLVFTDFGWEVVSQLKEAGFSKAKVVFYWSFKHGHIGHAQNIFYAQK